MKKLYILLIATCVFIPGKVLAVNEVDYSIPFYYIEATIQEDGSMDVIERIGQAGSFNGYYRDILYKNIKAPVFSGEKSDFYSSDLYNGSNITDIKVYLLDPNTYEKSLSFERVTNASVGTSNVYTVSELVSGYNIKMFNSNSSGLSGYYVTYTVKDIVVIHEDVAELNWVFLGADFIDTISDLKITVNLPYQDKDLKVWLHGQLDGEIIINNDYKSTTATIQKLFPKTAVDVRMGFDKELVPNAVKKSGIKALPFIMEVEKERADEANVLRSNFKKGEDYGNFIFIFIIIFFIVARIFLYFKFDKERKPDFKNKYNREFPVEYDVEGVEYILNRGISSKTLSAIILEMIRRKVFKVEPLGKDFVFYNLETDISLLSNSEKFVYVWLVNSIGMPAEGLKMSTIKKWGIINSAGFQVSFTRFKKEIKESLGTKVYENKLSFNIIRGVLVLFGISSLFLYSFVTTSYMYGTLPYGGVQFFIMIIFVVLIIVNLGLISKKTQYGMEEYVKLKALKKFLKDFGRFDEKELPEIILWERYLVFAAAFGIAKKVEKAMKIKIETVSSYDSSTFVLLGATTAMDSGIGSFTSGLVDSISSSMPTSASGSGGGASGGGGSGGGGGGGGGF